MRKTSVNIRKVVFFPLILKIFKVEVQFRTIKASLGRCPYHLVLQVFLKIMIFYLVIFLVLVNHLKNTWDLYGNCSG